MADKRVIINARTDIGYDKLYPETKFDNLNVTLIAKNWIYDSVLKKYVQTISVAGISLTGANYIVSPAVTSYQQYFYNGVYMIEPTRVDSVTFYADAPLSSNVIVNILKVGV